MFHGNRMLVLAGAILAVSLPVHAETIEVKGAGVKFAPEYIKGNAQAKPAKGLLSKFKETLK